MRKLEGVIEAQQFDKETLEAVFDVADKMERSYPNSEKTLAGKILISLFYEESTRTRFSFESAMMRLGGNVIGTENARRFSSASKGESLEDTVRVVSGYGDIIVLRYYKEGGAVRAREFSRVPVINAGDGAGQHPTQALLDLYTIRKFFGDINGLKIAMVGDLFNGRTVRSLCYFLAKHYSSNEIYLVSPKRLRMKEDMIQYLNRYNVRWLEESDLDYLLPELDVIYMTRVQKERIHDACRVYGWAKRPIMKCLILWDIIRNSKKLMINENSLKLMKPGAIIMHPLPRRTEISFKVDKDKRAVYFDQAQNGLYIRMALLEMALLGY